MNHILYQKHETLTVNPPIRIYVNKIGNKITFEVKTGYCLQPLRSERIKLLRITKGRVNKNDNGENVPHLEITGVALVHYNIVNNEYQINSRVLLPVNRMVSYYTFP